MVEDRQMPADSLARVSRNILGELGRRRPGFSRGLGIDSRSTLSLILLRLRLKLVTFQDMDLLVWLSFHLMPPKTTCSGFIDPATRVIAEAG